MILYIIWFLVAAAALMLYQRRTYSWLSSKGVKNPPTSIIFGNMGRMVLRREHFSDMVTRVYRSFPGERFAGHYEFRAPVIVLRDLDLIKQVIVKDFEHFLNHRMFFNTENDPLFGRNLFFLKDDDWKDMRGTLSPAFTSSKIRLMVPFMLQVAQQMVNTLTEKIKASKDGYLDIDVKDLTTRYTNDVIASCAFGLKVNSHDDVDNEFYNKGNDAVTFRFRQMIRFIGYLAIPKIMNAFKVPFLSEESGNFFRTIIQGTMRSREEKNIVRPDMIHLLMQAKKGTLTYDDKVVADTDAGFATVEESSVGKKKVNRAWSDDDLTSQAILFFIAGFETVSTCTSFLLHELALNPDVQDKLLLEIKETEEKIGGQLDYTTIQGMTYMDMVISETLRKWPPVVAAERECSKDYNLGKPNEEAIEDYIIRKGFGLYVPVWALHHNPDYFSDPERFDPERFSEENKDSIKPFTYLPFGLGPRNCIGSRFALCEVKVMAYELLKSFQLSPAVKTQVPAQLDFSTFNVKIQGGHWVRFHAR